MGLMRDREQPRVTGKPSVTLVFDVTGSTLDAMLADARTITETVLGPDRPDYWMDIGLYGAAQAQSGDVVIWQGSVTVKWPDHPEF